MDYPRGRGKTARDGYFTDSSGSWVSSSPSRGSYHIRMYLVHESHSGRSDDGRMGIPSLQQIPLYGTTLKEAKQEGLTYVRILGLKEGTYLFTTPDGREVNIAEINPRLAHWTSAPEYSYEQFYRTNPRKSRVRRNPEEKLPEMPKAARLPVPMNAGPYLPNLFQTRASTGFPAEYKNNPAYGVCWCGKKAVGELISAQTGERTPVCASHAALWNPRRGRL